MAAELHDPAGIERAARWHPPERLPAERRSHYYIELGRAQFDLGHYVETHDCLRAAQRIAPQHTREHPQFQRALAALRQNRTVPPDLG